MLILSRREHEAISIGDIVVIVVEIHGNRVRLGIDAPKDVAIHRMEVAEAIRECDQRTARLDAERRNEEEIE